IDGYEPFLAEGTERARRRGVSHQVRWVSADVHHLPRALTRKRFHASIMLGLDPLPAAARLLRTHTLPGGVYVIDDCIRAPRHLHIPPALAETPTLAECNARIAALGDTVEAVHVPSPSAVRRINRRLFARLANNARHLQRQHPRLRPALRDFLLPQRPANALLEG